MPTHAHATADGSGARKIQDYAGETTYRKLCRTLRIGDIILTCDGTEALRPIVAFQNRFSTDFPAASRKFTHVALYIGNERIVHSMPDPSLDHLFSGGVEEIPLRKLFAEGMTFAAIRYPGLKDEHHDAMHEAISSHIGSPYDYMAIVRCVGFLAPNFLRRAYTAVRNLGWRFWSTVDTASLETGRAFLCSDFVHAVYDEMFQAKNPCNTTRGYVGPVRMPCEFYANPNFVDVDIDAA